MMTDCLITVHLLALQAEAKKHPKAPLTSILQLKIPTTCFQRIMLPITDVKDIRWFI